MVPGGDPPPGTVVSARVRARPRRDTAPGLRWRLLPPAGMTAGPALEPPHRGYDTAGPAPGHHEWRPFGYGAVPRNTT